MASVTLAEIIQRTRVSDGQLDLQIADDHLNKIADNIDNWPKYAEVLNLKGHQKEDVKTTLGITYLMRIQQVLRNWKENESFNATYRNLIEAALKVGDSSVAIQVCTLCRECTVDESPDHFPSFMAWLEYKGVSPKDLRLLEDEGFSTAQGFATMLPEDINDLNLTRAGKRLLPQLISQLQVRAQPVRSPSSGAGNCGSADDTPRVTSTGSGSRLREANNEIDYSQTDCSNAYNTMVRCSVKLNHAMSKDPKSLALSLYSAGFIAQSTLDETVELNETKSSKGSRLYSAVLGRVRSFPKKFADFIEILRKDRSLYGDVLPEIDRVYNE